MAYNGQIFKIPKYNSDLYLRKNTSGGGVSYKECYFNGGYKFKMRNNLSVKYFGGLFFVLQCLKWKECYSCCYCCPPNSLIKDFTHRL